MGCAQGCDKGVFYLVPGSKKGRSVGSRRDCRKNRLNVGWIGEESFEKRDRIGRGVFWRERKGEDDGDQKNSRELEHKSITMLLCIYAYYGGHTRQDIPND